MYFRQFNLKLWPASGVLAPGSQFLVQQSDGSLEPLDYADHGTLYQGKLEGLDIVLMHAS